MYYKNKKVFFIDTIEIDNKKDYIESLYNKEVILCK